jgi:N-acetylmuramoyl-L-alanine amidase CwlA
MVEIKQNLVSKEKYSIKCPYEMTPEFIVVHNTANDAPAQNEIAYMIRNDNQVSFHYAIDDKEIVQGLLENRNGWHASDGGQGQGNRKGIAIEICYSKSGGDRFIQAEKNTAEFIAMKLKEKGWGIDRVKKHQDFTNKYCPHRTLDMGWDRFLNMIKSYMEEKPVQPTKQPTYKVGDTVTINGVYTASTSDKKLKPAVTKGTITKIIAGARNPYLLNDGNIGWVNDDCIVAGKTKLIETKPVADNTIKVGDKVRVKQGAKSYKGVALAPFVYNTVYDVMQLNGDRAVIGTGGAVTTDIHINNLYK